MFRNKLIIHDAPYSVKILYTIFNGSEICHKAETNPVIEERLHAFIKPFFDSVLKWPWLPGAPSIAALTLELITAPSLVSVLPLHIPTSVPSLSSPRG